MNTIILQKKYLVLVETAKDMWTLFLVIVNFIFTIREKINNKVNEVKNKVTNFSKVLYSYFFNINRAYIPLLISIDNRSNDIAFKNNDDSYIYSNLLSPPHF